jgi:L-ascorbate metabolism protein UlaG (beta-lactamase superfamily)
MNVQLIGHATVLMNSENFSLICDPWLKGDYVNNCTVWQFPPREFGIETINKFKYIYISHDHEDHCNAETLKFINKKTPIFILRFNENKNLIKRLTSMNFTNVTEIEGWKKYEIDEDTSITIFPSDLGYVDSSALISHKNFVIYHGNDNVLYPETVKKISKISNIDIAFMPYAGFSGFPSCYEFSDEIKNKLAEKKKNERLESFYECVEALNPKKVVPAAGDLIIVGENKAWANYFDRASPIEAIEKAPKNIKDKMLDMRPGDIYSHKGIIKYKKKNNWEYTSESQEKFYSQDHVKNEVKRYENWIQNLKITAKDFSDLVLTFFKQGLENKSTSAIENYKFLLISKNKNLAINLLIDFDEKKIETLTDQNFSDYSKKIIIDPLVLCRIIRHEILWGDAYCGLSLTLDRKPYDNYNLNFWKWLYGLDALEIDYKKYFD